MEETPLSRLSPNYDKYAGEPVSFRDKGDHYELTFTGEFGSLCRENHVFTDLIEDLKDGTKDYELHIFISSVGGDAETLAAILQQVLQYRQRVTICSGLCCSAGFFLWAAGNERYASRYSELMYHAPPCCYEAKVTELNDFSRHMEKITEGLIEATSLRSLIPEQDVERGRTTEVWYTGSDFIERGLAKDYRDYPSRVPPNLVAVLEAGGRFFAKWGERYKELHLTAGEDDVLEYTDLVSLASGEGSPSESTAEEKANDAPPPAESSPRRKPSKPRKGASKN
jgi:ATP-dependent protease ClpP protease subunit